MNSAKLNKLKARELDLFGDFFRVMCTDIHVNYPEIVEIQLDKLYHKH